MSQNMIIAFCTCCKEDIDSFGSRTKYIYEKICDHYLKTKEPFQVCDEDWISTVYDRTIMRFLEKRKYVSIEEKDNNLKITPIQYETSDEINVFCKCNTKEVHSDL